VAHQHLAHRAAGVGRIPGQHLVHDAGEAVLIAPSVEVVRADRLLGAHVHRRAERDPRLGDRRILGRGAHVRDPEIGDDGDPALEQDVLRLDVAVDDPFHVCTFQRTGDFDADAHGRVHGELALAPDPVAQRLAAHVRHHVVQQPIRVARVVEGEDVGMRELRRDRDLALEALPADRLRHVGEEHLERDVAVVLSVAGQKHHGHPAAAELPLDRVPVRQRRSQSAELL
jgi:hypothetical protein